MCSSFSRKNLKVVIIVCSLINSFCPSMLDRDELTVKFVIREITYQILEVIFICKSVIFFSVITESRFHFFENHYLQWKTYYIFFSLDAIYTDQWTVDEGSHKKTIKVPYFELNHHLLTSRCVCVVKIFFSIMLEGR